MRLFKEFSFWKCVQFLKIIGKRGLHRFIKSVSIFNIIAKSRIIIKARTVIKFTLITLPVFQGDIGQISAFPDDLNIISEVEDGSFP